MAPILSSALLTKLLKVTIFRLTTLQYAICISQGMWPGFGPSKLPKRAKQSIPNINRSFYLSVGRVHVYFNSRNQEMSQTKYQDRLLQILPFIFSMRSVDGWIDGPLNVLVVVTSWPSASISQHSAILLLSPKGKFHRTVVSLLSWPGHVVRKPDKYISKKCQRHHGQDMD